MKNRTDLSQKSKKILALSCLMTLVACNDDNTETVQNQPIAIPQLSPAVAAKMAIDCQNLTRYQYNKTVITDAEVQATGVLKVGNNPIPEHCLIKGYMEQRVSPIDGQTYQIGFEMRLPMQWNGRFLYQGNGGTDGNIVNAVGNIGSGGPISNALYTGFAVISSDAGHNATQNPLFGLDPEARINYGYAAMGKLTPMAKDLIKFTYGKYPDRSYAGGSSNGGRHAMVAATRFADQFDGIVANAPGFHLPRAAAAQLYTAQQLRRVATDENDLSTALTLAERQVLADSILAKCDALDGIDDGMVQDIDACRTAFNIFKDVPTCQTNQRDGQCLTELQLDVIDKIYTGPINAKGEHLYATQPYDPGLIGNNWASWKFSSSVGSQRDPVAVGIIFQVPPNPSVMDDSRKFAFNYNFDTDFAKLFNTDQTYTESAMSFMLPPNELNLDTILNKGGKMIIVHGASDGVFSVDDTQNWYDKITSTYSEKSIQASDFVRFFRVPGMNHTSAGIATDQFDALTALVRWVEYGEKPDQIIATARGIGNSSGVINTEIPQNWFSDRTRPLCFYPLVARYNGQGNSEKAENFSCK